ncbi:MAG TPA: phosphoribosylformylglycinamidine synthase subunit PurL [Firmicutes bacterium]|nr:phosphoribosylformylglycinamidine synthase subunit PurL [Bacillota bacterium]
MKEDKRWLKLGLTDKEYRLICKDLGREPNFCELSMFSVMWSEHCSYKHSKSSLRLFPVTGERVLQGPGENAGVIDLGSGWAVAFKIESHNHPSAVDPYQGAATGVGGIVRDIFTMGARPVALLNSLRLGPLSSSRSRYLFKGIVAGVADYGNGLELPVVAGETGFENCYEGNPLVNAMCVGVLPVEQLIRGKAPEPGNLVALAGAPTGRDGIHGVTFASEELAPEAAETAVHIGDPAAGRLLMEACLELARRKLVLGMQDLGGAGLTCAATEMAARSGTGMEISLDPVPLKEENMAAYEIAISESQERMLLVLAPEHEQEAAKVFKSRGLNFNTIGKVTGDGFVRIKYRDRAEAEVPASSVAEGAPEYSPPVQEPEYYRRLAGFNAEQLPPEQDLNQVLKQLLESPDAASREWIWRQFSSFGDHQVVQGPGGDAGIIRLSETGQGIAVTVDGSSRLVYLDPYLGGMFAVAEATRNLSCVGAKPLGITDGLNFGNPERPEVYWQFRRAVEGVAEACRVLQVPVVGGNVSFYNEVDDKAIYPTPVVGAVGLLEDPQASCQIAFNRSSDIIYLLGSPRVSLGGSLYLKICHHLVAGTLAEIDLKLEKSLQEVLYRAIRRQALSSAHDLSEGGLAVTLAECCLQGNTGATVSLPGDICPRLALFGEGPSRVLVSLHPDKEEDLQALALEHGIPLIKLGQVGGDRLVIISGGQTAVDLAVEEIGRIYREVIGCLMS